MGSVTFVAGKMQAFKAKIEFSLNFEDKKSVKVKVGDLVHYDGLTAKYKKLDGEEVTGKTSSLRSAINSNWLTLNTKGTISGPNTIKTEEKIRETAVEAQTPNYDTLKGGSFDSLVAAEGIDFDVTVTKKRSNVTREDDQVVKRTQATVGIRETRERERLKVAGDQVDVKEVSPSSTVSSSTAVPPALKNRNTTVIRSEDYGAERTTARKASSAPASSSKAKTFTVNDSTPRLADDATLTEVRRATTVIGEEAQDGKVVRKVGPRIPEVVQLDGVTLKNNTPTASGDEPVVKVGSGSSSVTDLSGAKTQDDVDKVTGVDIAKTGSQRFMDLMPKDWAELHWTKKEKFVMQITDYDFVKFLMTVDNVKAVQNACRKRMSELLKKG